MRRAFIGLVVICVVSCSSEKAPLYQQLVLPNTPLPKDIGATVRIEAGSFPMGAPGDAEERDTSPREGWIQVARPLHKEIVPKPFEIGKYEVTAKEFCDFLNDYKSHGIDVKSYVRHFDNMSTVIRRGDLYMPRPGFEYAPALHVQLEGARQYCRWLSEETGDTYRLPSEIEWEYVARGSEGRTYPWGESSPLGKAFLFVHYMKYTKGPRVLRVGLFPEGATPEGVHDMIGDATEWCGNCFYQYTQECIGGNEEQFRDFVEPVGGCPDSAWVLGGPVSVPGGMVATRGGQYVDYDDTATGWTRFSEPASPVKYNEPGAIGVSFRVLKEIH